MLSRDPSKYRPCLRVHKHESGKHMGKNGEDIHIVIGVFRITLGAEFNKCIATIRARMRYLSMSDRVRGSAKANRTRKSRTRKHRHRINTVEIAIAIDANPRDRGSNRGKIRRLAFVYERAWHRWHRYSRVQVDWLSENGRQYTYGLELAWGLRGAGTSHRTKGP